MKKRVLSLLLCTARQSAHYPVVEKMQEKTKERLQKYLEMMQGMK